MTSVRISGVGGSDSSSASSSDSKRAPVMADFMLGLRSNSSHESSYFGVRISFFSSKSLRSREQDSLMSVDMLDEPEKTSDYRVLPPLAFSLGTNKSVHYFRASGFFSAL